MRQIGIKRNHVLMGFALLGCLVPLYWAKTEADNMRNHMRGLQKEVNDARKNVHILEAEIAYLERYDRIEKVATEQLSMVPLSAGQIVDIKEIDQIAPIIAQTGIAQTGIGQTGIGQTGIGQTAQNNGASAGVVSP